MKRISRGLYYSLGNACCRLCFHRGRHKHRDKQLLRKAERNHYKKELKKEIKE